MKKNANKTHKVGTNRNPKPGRQSGDEFWNQADSFRQAASALLDVLRRPANIQNVAVPLVFLYLRSLELSCKACLPIDKYSDAKIMKEFGHRLTALLDELEENRTLEHLQITRQEFLLVDDFSDDYSDKWIEYGNGYIELPDLELLSGLVERFVAATRDYMISSH